ncbi:endo-alpha-1,5-arabinanase [Dactylonectria estremocensis]|uniref:Arabinan endo-1,5-alpha-L-arabinosidase n=1 Tax=Dactylonectria estremocensis TaxID=1079267 RepID=A0A9P9J3N9_9HYPO|nr:endo-alpha-1,5-arabinanase [Dactylonectria estremocensis]
MKFWSFVKALLPVALLATEASAYADPGSCSGACWSHDPSVIRRTSDGVYFRFETGSLIGIWKASALTGPWVYQGAAIPKGSIINLTGKDDLWAPDVQKVGDQYIMYYTVSSFGSQNSAIGYATSTTMEYGSWTDRGTTGVTSSSSNTYNAIDGNLIVDQSGNNYLNFGSFWGDIYQVKLNSAATTASGTPYQIAFNSTGSQALEGASMYYRSGYYYLMFSSGICCGYNTALPAQGEEYKIFVCRSTSVSGPFVDKAGKSCTTQNGGTLLLSSHGNVYGPGGQGMFADPTYGTVLYYHYADKTVGLADANYRFGWNTVSWSSGWPSV